MVDMGEVFWETNLGARLDVIVGYILSYRLGAILSARNLCDS